jgi:aspartate-semialdehyde dehydrogenase
MDPQVPLVIPEINAHALENHSGIISSPNCTATVMLMATAPLHRQFKIRRIVMATYQAASGAGQKAMLELQEESRAILENRTFIRTAMPFPYAFNLFAHNAPMTSSGYNEEEIKVVEEARKILEEPELRIAVTCVRVPVLRAHSEALNVEFENPITAAQAKEVLQKAPGVTVLEDWDQNRFPMPLDASGQDNIFVGRIRQDLSNPNTLDLWAVGDQLLKGAALNAIQIAEALCLQLQKKI